MPELIIRSRRKKAKKAKPIVRLDLTAMVDLAFLLITFFMLTTNLAKPRIMDLSVPSEAKTLPGNLQPHHVLNILLDEGNHLAWYVGQPRKPITTLKLEHCNKEVIQKIILHTRKEFTTPSKLYAENLIILIKPTNQSNYKTLVEALDAIKASATKQYSIAEVTQEDVNLLKKAKSSAKLINTQKK